MNSMNKKPVRVCFVSPKSYPLFDHSIDAVFGGAEVDLYMLGTELAKDPGFDVSFVVADYGQASECEIEGVRLIKSLSFKENALAGAIKVWRAMRKADSDIYMFKTASPGVPLAVLFWLMLGINAALQRSFTFKKIASR